MQRTLQTDTFTSEYAGAYLITASLDPSGLWWWSCGEASGRGPGYGKFTETRDQALRAARSCAVRLAGGEASMRIHTIETDFGTVHASLRAGRITLHHPASETMLTYGTADLRSALAALADEVAREAAEEVLRVAI